MSYEIVCIGTSHGGLSALQRLLPALPKDFAAPLCIVQHRSRDMDYGLCEYLQKRCQLEIREPNDKEKIMPGVVYLAPRDYHLFVEHGGFALSVEAPVAYARPSVDVLFESAADAYRERAIGVILTGSNRDGAKGLVKIKDRGGVCIVQQPAEAETSQMPQAAIDAVTAERVDYILPMNEIAGCLLRLCAATEARQVSRAN